MNKVSIGALIGAVIALLMAPLFVAVVVVAVLVPASQADACENTVGVVAGGWRTPVVSAYKLTARFGQTGGMWSSGHHTGLDFAVIGPDKTIVAAAGGKVTTTDYSAAYGNQVVIDHGGGISTRYGHMAQPSTVKVGETVNAGARLGTEGATGNVTGAHLHLEVIRSGTTIDPEAFLKDHGVTLNGSPVEIARPQTVNAANSTSQSVTATRTDGQKVTLGGEQLTNAATITAVAHEKAVSDRGQVIALMAALQESTLRNLDYGDRDSLGLFQQRAGWGSATERQTPRYAAAAFFGGADGPNRGSPPGLLDTPGWEQMGLGQAAQAVQVSAYPDLYDRWEPVARAVLSAVGGTVPSGCNAASVGELRIATWNVCAQYCDSKIGTWPTRVGAVTGQLTASGADVLVLQETGKSGGHGKQLRAALAGRYKQAAYHRSRMILINPEKISTKSASGADLPPRTLGQDGRFGVMQVLRVKATGSTFVLADVHPVQGKSEANDASRASYLRAVLDLAGPMSAGGSRPIVLAGDFNTTLSGRGTLVSALLSREGYDTAETLTKNRTGAEWDSYNGGGAPSEGRRIDHVVVPTASVTVQGWAQTVAAGGQKPPSDHNMITVDLSFSASATT